jgi:hypothetical protein
LRFDAEAKVVFPSKRTGDDKMAFNVTWNDGTTTEFATLPEKVQEIFGCYGQQTMQRFAAAKANSQVRKQLANGGKSSEVTTAQVKEWIEGNTAQYEAWQSDHLAEFKRAALAGEIDMPGVSEESLTQDELDRRAAAKKTIEDIAAKSGKRFKWARAGKGAGEEAQLAAAQQRENELQTFLTGCVDGGPFAGFVRDFNRNLAAIKRSRVKSDAPEAQSVSDLLALTAQ